MLLMVDSGMLFYLTLTLMFSHSHSHFDPSLSPRTLMFTHFDPSLSPRTLMFSHFDPSLSPRSLMFSHSHARFSARPLHCAQYIHPSNLTKSASAPSEGICPSVAGSCLYSSDGGPLTGHAALSSNHAASCHNSPSRMSAHTVGGTAEMQHWRLSFITCVENTRIV